VPALIVSTAVAEFFSWLLVYRTPNYMRLTEELDRSSRKLEAIKQSTPASRAAKATGKKEKRLEEHVKTTNRDLTTTRMKLAFITMGTMLLSYNFVGTMFDGVVMGKLPFQPFGFISNITHRGLLGDDLTECGAAFIYALSATYWKMNISKMFGFAPSRAAARLANPGTKMADKFK